MNLSKAVVATLTLIVAVVLTAPADARRRHAPRPSRATILEVLLRKQATELASVKAEIAALRRELRPEVLASVEVRPLPPPRPLLGVPSVTPDLRPATDGAVHVYPATATQRGQHGDQRRTHRHAGLDLGGAYGSPIVASFAGCRLPPPGRDRGYGPMVVVIRGEDGIVYRYAHLSRVIIGPRQCVRTGERIGYMGKVGPRGFPHLHFEMIPVAEYRRRPYGLHRLNPNDYLGGRRGTRMAAGLPMTGRAAVQYAQRHRPVRAAGQQ